MDLLRDLYYTNLSALRNTSKSLMKNWLFIFTGLFYTIATIFLYSIIQYFGILAGIVLLITTSATISNYIYLLEGIITRNRITLQDFKDGFTIYLRKVWGLLFMFWVGRMAFDLLIQPILGQFIDPIGVEMIGLFLAFVILNPIPEILYQKHYNPWESITYSFEFVKDNWIEWFIPNAIFLGLIYLVTGQILAGIINFYIPINVLFSSGGIILYLLGQVIFTFMMIYRGYLFNTLSTSNRRKRLFMRRF